LGDPFLAVWEALEKSVLDVLSSLCLLEKNCVVLHNIFAVYSPFNVFVTTVVNERSELGAPAFIVFVEARGFRVDHL